MKIYYLHMEDRRVFGIDPALHIEWKDVKPLLEKHDFLVIASGNANHLSCSDIEYKGTANEMHIFNPAIKKWVIFPVAPSVTFNEAIRRGSVPVKAAITKYQNGRKGSWKIAALMVRPKQASLHKFMGDLYSLAPLAWDNPVFEDDDKIKAAMRRAVVNGGRKTARANRKIVAAENLPLPTEVPGINLR